MPKKRIRKKPNGIRPRGLNRTHNVNWSNRTSSVWIHPYIIFETEVQVLSFSQRVSMYCLHRDTLRAQNYVPCLICGPGDLSLKTSDSVEQIKIEPFRFNKIFGGFFITDGSSTNARTSVRISLKFAGVLSANVTAIPRSKSPLIPSTGNARIHLDLRIPIPNTTTAGRSGGWFKGTLTGVERRRLATDESLCEIPWGEPSAHRDCKSGVQKTLQLAERQWQSELLPSWFCALAGIRMSRHIKQFFTGGTNIRVFAPDGLVQEAGGCSINPTSLRSTKSGDLKS
jgi:hypothetical protein